MLSNDSSRTWPHSRTMGMKLLIVTALALFFLIPGLLVGSLVDERSNRAAEVSQEIGQQVGGPQVLLGPTLAVPYTDPAAPDQPKLFLVFPRTGRATLRTATEERHRSLFRVPVFRADVLFEAKFNLAQALADAPAGSVLDWSHAQVILGTNDPRGILSNGRVQLAGADLPLASIPLARSVSLSSTPAESLALAAYTANAAHLATSGTEFDVSATWHISGSQRISVIPWAGDTDMQISGDWSSPGFATGFLPVESSITHSGFNASWAIPAMAQGGELDGTPAILQALYSKASGVSFIEVAGPYQSVQRSLKYLLLFVGLVFLSYFVFEATTGQRVHPAQYLLVGAAQIIFYLLLLSLAERIGFGGAYSLAGAATVLLLSVNARWVFASVREGRRAFIVFALLYAHNYLLLRLEDSALLLGAIASFLALTAAMYLTRNLDWYGSFTGATPATMAEPSSPSA
jgi:inner membrane protein